MIEPGANRDQVSRPHRTVAETATSTRFIVCAPRYSDTSGGSIALHKLAQLLRDLGHEVLLWPLHRVNLNAPPFSIDWWRRYSYIATRLYRPLYSTLPGSELNLARKGDISGAVVVYPDVVHGNPLQARRYVRWLLYHFSPGADERGFSDGDLYFCYQVAFNHGYAGMRYGGILHVEHLLLDIYKRTNFNERTGACYMVRKGKSRSDLPSLRGKLVVDSMDHRTLADVFNRVKYCYFYDPYTTYSTYAAVCGCIPVVVPVPGVGRAEWEPNGGRKPGIAYGEEDIPYAIQTRQLLLEHLADADKQNLESVRKFVTAVNDHFQS